jgi:hypothetical protein
MIGSWSVANQITDQRTSVDGANSTTGWTTLSSTSPTNDTDIKIEGAGSNAEQCTNSRRTLIYDTGSSQTWANHVAYVWVNCGIVGLLATKTGGGMRVRVTGSSATDYKEWDVGGSDEWPIAIEGGWVQFVVDLEGTPDATGGTTPTNNSIQGIGISFITNGTMPKVADNTWIDEIAVIADGTAPIRIEGSNGGTTPWTWADVLTQLTVSSGCIKAGPAGTYVLNSAVQVGINDGTTHEFEDTNQVILFDRQDTIPTDHYSFTAVGGTAGTTNVTLGAVTGTGVDATGAQGCTFIGDSADPNRCAWDFDDPNIDAIGLYGCTFQHQGDFQLDDAANDVISCLFIDCNSGTVNNSNFLKNKIIDANTTASNAFLSTDDFGDIRYCEFEHSAGHAINITSTSPSSQNNVGNLFSGYTNSAGSAEAAIENSTAGALTINSSGGSNLGSNSYRNSGGGSTTINNNISVTFADLADNTEVRVYSAGTTTELDGIENATAGSPGSRTFTASISASTSVDYVIHNVDYEYIRVETYTWPTADTTITVQQRTDRNYSNP